jgi:hypothetical protein
MPIATGSIILVAVADTDPRVLAWRTPRSDWESALEDVKAHRNQSVQERLTDLDRLCRMAMQLLEQFPADERRRLLEYQEPLSPEHESIWRRLVAAGRAEKAGHPHGRP